jgi:hypothetical protein
MQQPRRLCSVVQGTVNRGYRLLPPVRVAQHVDHAAACVDDVLATHMPFTFLHYMYAQAVPVLHQQRSPHSLPGVAQQALASSAVTHWDHSFAASCASWLRQGCCHLVGDSRCMLLLHPAVQVAAAVYSV